MGISLPLADDPGSHFGLAVAKILFLEILHLFIGVAFDFVKIGILQKRAEGGHEAGLLFGGKLVPVLAQGPPRQFLHVEDPVDWW